MSAQTIAAIVAALAAINVLVSQLFGYSVFAEGQIEAIVNGISALYIVVYGIWIKYKNGQLEAQLQQAQADMEMWKSRYNKSIIN